MDNLAKRLSCKMEVYKNAHVENELGEIDLGPEKIKNVYGEIIPIGGMKKTLIDNNVYADISHKITVRANAIPNLSNDMYFLYKGLRFDINYFEPNYKLRNSIECMCSLVVQ